MTALPLPPCCADHEPAAGSHLCWIAGEVQRQGLILDRLAGLAEATHASIAAAVREEIAALASRVGASFPADHPAGARASFADYLRVLAEEKP